MAPSRAANLAFQKRTMDGSRLVVELRYVNSDDTDRFEWELYNPSELERMAARHALTPHVMCADWDEAVDPSPDKGRMQFVFQKGGQ